MWIFRKSARLPSSGQHERIQRIEKTIRINAWNQRTRSTKCIDGSKPWIEALDLISPSLGLYVGLNQYRVQFWLSHMFCSSSVLSCFGSLFFLHAHVVRLFKVLRTGNVLLRLFCRGLCALRSSKCYDNWIFVRSADRMLNFNEAKKSAIKECNPRVQSQNAMQNTMPNAIEHAITKATKNALKHALTECNDGTQYENAIAGGKRNSDSRRIRKLHSNSNQIGSSERMSKSNSNPKGAGTSGSNSQSS